MNDFYVGYASSAPPNIARLIRWTVVALLLGAASLATIVVGSQQKFPPSFFEFSDVREFQGTMDDSPYPSILIPRPGVTAGDARFSRYFLVGEGKHGADHQISGVVGKQVKLRGKLIYRDATTMIELAPGSISIQENSTPFANNSTFSLGPTTLTGEIVDTKCYLGVMNPGQGKVHRDCAARCLHGGVPPALLVRNSAGGNALYLLTNLDGTAIPPDRVAVYAGAPITLRGTILTGGDTLYLATADLNPRPR